MSDEGKNMSDEGKNMSDEGKNMSDEGKNMSDEEKNIGNEEKKENRKKAATAVSGKTDKTLLLFAGVTFSILLGQLLGSLIIGIVTFLLRRVVPSFANSDVWETAGTYLTFIGIWIVMLSWMGLNKKNRPLLSILGTKCRGNSLPGLLLGTASGFGLNAFCILAAWLHNDIYLEYVAFRPAALIFLLISVFIQSSAEELVCRGFLYQQLLKNYGKPVVAIIGNSLLFALLHLLNEGVTVLSILNIFLSGVLFSLMVYYFDSLWAAFAAHAAWNYTQNIVFGLPNSGIVVPFSIFKLDASVARDSFAYNVGFGIEGTVVAVLVLALACIGLFFLGRKIHKNAA